MNNHYPPNPSKKPRFYTINPVEVDPGPFTPEFCRLDDLRQLFGITRSYAYILMNDGKIKTISLRRPGQKHSVRLVHVASVREFLNRLLKEQNGGIHAEGSPDALLEK